jgi:3-oxoacyl-[acyl-carrier-protein] synthase II
MDVVAPVTTPAPAIRTGGPGPARTPLAVVTDWSVISAAGRDPADVKALSAAAGSWTSTAGSDVAGPLETVCLVKDFDVRAELGRKGTRTFDRATALAVTTIGRLAPRVFGTQDDPPGTGTGLLIGTSIGSVQSTMDFTRDALTGDRPFLVDPARFPNTVMNFTAGQCAIWHGLRGPNATLTAGRSTGVHAIRYASRWLRLGHAKRVIVAATEEMSPQRAWLESHAGADRDVPLGEACAALVLESAATAAAFGLPVLVEVLSVATAMAVSPDRRESAMRRSVQDALAGLDGPLDLHAPYDARAGSTERTVVGSLTGSGPRPRLLATCDVLGDTGAVSALLQMQGAVAVLRQDGAPGPRHALVTALDGEGVAGAMLLRVPGGIS